MQLNILDAIREGQQLKEQGIKKALDHADVAFPSWTERAYSVLIDYLNDPNSNSKFKAEDIRLWAKLKDKIEDPPSKRAWGGIILRAKYNGLIQSCGITNVVNPKAHRANCTLWQKV